MADAPVLLDFESRSRVKLPDIGGRNYWAHWSTEPLCCHWHDLSAGTDGAWHPGDPAPPWANKGRVLAAHNMSGFDRHGCYRFGWSKPSDTWIDTSELARRAGLPGSLEMLGELLGVAKKDKDASRFVTSLSQVRRPSGKKNPNAIDADVWRDLSEEERMIVGVQTEITPEVMARVDPYCALDVRVMREAWPVLEPWSEYEPEVSRVERAVNDRGVYFDQELARALLECDHANSEGVMREVAQSIGWTAADVRRIVNSPKQFTEATGLDNAQAATIDDVLLDPLEDPKVLALCRARRALASIARGKLEAGLRLVSPDSRLRDAQYYCGGHTWRWSGRGMQLQNMPRPAPYFEKIWKDAHLTELQVDDWIANLADRVRDRKHVATQDEIDLLVRATIRAAPGHRLAVVDFAGVEMRANSWAAQDRPYLKAIREKLDVYKFEASGIFGKPYADITKDERGVGKVAVLALGYQMGGNKYGDTCLKAGVNLEAMGLNPFEIVGKWRRVHKAIKYFWREMEDAFVCAVNGETATASALGLFTFTPSEDGHDVAMWLPSGRPIVYNDARISGDGSIVYWGQIKPGVWGDVHVYGGLLVENAIQGMCRDLMAEALVGAEDLGLSPVMHVHDEIVCEVPADAGEEGLTLLHNTMMALPTWAYGFPVGAAGFHAVHYRK